MNCSVTIFTQYLKTRKKLLIESIDVIELHQA
jgi:hypothetical protein